MLKKVDDAQAARQVTENSPMQSFSSAEDDENGKNTVLKMAHNSTYRRSKQKMGQEAFIPKFTLYSNMRQGPF